MCEDPTNYCSQWVYCESSDPFCGGDAIHPTPTPQQPMETPTASPEPHPTTAARTNYVSTEESTIPPAPEISDESPWEDWVLSTEPRYNTTEADARTKCNEKCVSNSDHFYYCGKKTQPAPECSASTAPNGGFRCGVSELAAHETCGAFCSTDNECVTGEHCFALNHNLCDCNTNGGRRL